MSVYNITITAATRITTAINCVFMECQKEIFCCLCSVFIMISPSVIIFYIIPQLSIFSQYLTIFSFIFVCFRAYSLLTSVYLTSLNAGSCFGFARIRIWQSARCSLFISSAYSTSTVISSSFSCTSTR